MRLHALALTAFGPFAGTESIDMDALTASGLFLLEGPTGAGKSTILDAITFALYGATAGTESSTDRLRSHFAPPDAVPEVVLELSVGGERLRITRVPDHLRPKKRGDGVTLEKGHVHLEKLDAGAWASVSSHVQEANTEIRDRVGLTPDQFTKVVLLPQGEFATFLRADDDVRRILLTQIFGTGLYDKVTRELENRRTEASRLRDAAAASVDTAVAAADEAAGVSAGDEGSLAGTAETERPGRLAEIASRLADAAAAAGEEESQAAGAFAAATAERDALAQTMALVRDLAAARAAVEQHEATRPAHDARAAELAAALSAVPVGVRLEQLDTCETEVAAAHGALAALAPDPDSALAAGAAHHEAAARAADDEAAGLEHLVAREVALTEDAAGVARLGEARDAAAARLAAAQQACAALPARIDAATADRDAAVVQAAGADAAAADVARLEARADAATALAELLPRIEAASRALQGRVSARLAAHEAWNSLRERHLDGIAAVLSAQLRDGLPCAVCGSTEHPSPAEPADDAVTAEDVAAAESEYAAAQESEATAQSDLDALVVRRASLEAASSGVEVTAATADLAARRADLGAITAAAAQVEALGARVAELKAELVGHEATVTAESTSLAEAAATHGTRAAALAAASTEVEAARGSHPSVADLQRSLRADAQRARELGAAVAATTQAVERRDQALQSSTAAAAEAGFPNLAAARTAHRSGTQIAALQNAVDDWARTLAAREAAACDPRFAAVVAVDAAELVGRGTAAAAARAEAEARHRAATAAVATASLRLTRFEAMRAEVGAAVAHHADVVAGTAAVNRLAGLAKGTSGALRMNLTTYVLRRWFEQVVEAANVRLAAMSAGRYELERTDQAEKKSERTGLALRVVDRHTGEARSPKSLSGGETFYTSLALALGLADVVTAEAGGVELDTLFIDEGFGTLDPETLDQVMSVIDDLRDRGRAVGIVSHVADLKDRITERLEVRRTNPQGPSHVRLHA
jgi:exonuclease SbcC